MFYYANRRKKTKKIVLITIGAVLLAALIVLAVIFFDKISHFIRHGSFSDSAGSTAPAQQTETPVPEDLPPINEDGTTVGSRFNVPAGYERVPVEKDSFAEYLRNYTLLPYGTIPKLYDGTDNLEAPSVGVLDQEVKNRVQQCADAIIRLYGEYQYARKDYDNIYFYFNNTPRFRCDFATWITGQRVQVIGSKAEWYLSEDATPGDTSEATFRYYLQTVQIYANTNSLKDQMRAVTPSELQVGDVFIVTSGELGGGDGHAIVIVDMCVNPDTGEKLFICAEGNTPATETYILHDEEADTVWLHLEADGSFIKDGIVYPATAIRRF